MAKNAKYIEGVAATLNEAAAYLKAFRDTLRVDYVRDSVRCGLIYGYGVTPTSVRAEFEGKSGYVVRVRVTLRGGKGLNARVEKLYELYAALGAIRQPDGSALFFSKRA